MEQFDGSHDPFQFNAAFLTGQIITGPGDQAPDPVPEPSTIFLLALGLLAMLGMRYRRRVRTV